MPLSAPLTTYASALSAALIIVTHDPAQARRLSERIVTLEDGRVRQPGPPSA